MAINSLLFADIDKPYPETTFWNTTFKVMCFLYPPYGKKPIVVAYNAISPEPNQIYLMLTMAIFGLLLGFFFFNNIYKQRNALTLNEKQLENVLNGSQYGSPNMYQNTSASDLESYCENANAAAIELIKNDVYTEELTSDAPNDVDVDLMKDEIVQQ